MDVLYRALGVIALAAVLLLLAAVAGTLVGMAGGAIVAIWFNDPLQAALNALGVHGVALWQLGGLLGFVGGFFRSSTSTTKKEG